MRRLPSRFILALVLGLVVGGGFFVAVPSIVHGATTFSIENIGGSVGLGTADLREIAINVLKWVLGILGLVAVSFLIYGGFLWLTSGGNEERIEKAKRVIINAVIGLIIVLISWAIVLYVARVVGGATNGNTTPPGGCSNPPCSVLPPTANFRVKDIQTAHEIGFGNNQNVLRCSGVQPIFNNHIDSTTVAAALAQSPHELKVFKDDPAANNPEVNGTWGYGSQPSMTFSLGAGVKYDASSDYKLWIPKTAARILDSDGTQLTQCQADGSCTDLGNSYEWLFHVGTQDDTAAPQLANSYPVQSGATYPDTNVNREPVFTLNFSEPINLATVQPATTVLVEQISAQSGTVITGGPLDTNNDGIIDATFFDQPSSNGATGVDLRLIPPNRLEPFTWYRIIVKNIKDLCGNSLSGPVTWEFKTNDTVAGIESFNPTGSGQCTDQRDVFIVFSVPMNANTVRMRIKQTIGGATTDFDDVALFPGDTSYTNPTTNRGVFSIADPVNPVDNGWRVFKYTVGSAWKIDATYDVSVTTDRQIDTSGNTMNQAWSFVTAAPDQCSCTPYVAGLNPGSGGKEQCVSIIGACFTGTADHAATPRKPEFALTFSPPSPSPIPQGELKSSSAGAIVTKVPADPAFHVGADPSVRVTIDYADSTFGTKASNTSVKYHFNTNAASVGPCLVSLDKSEGFVGDTNAAHGEDFLAQGPQSRVDYNPLNPASVTTWSSAVIDHTVPGGQAAPQSQLVRVTDKDGNPSNALPFQLKDIAPPDAATPIVVSVAPNCGDACPNAGLIVQYRIDTGDMNTIEVKNAANYQIKECTDALCSAFAATTFTPNSFSYDTTIKTVQFGKAPDFAVSKNYRIIIGNAVKSDTGKALGNLNYDADGNGTKESYSWTFKTKSAACSLSTVTVSPTSATLTAADQTQSFVATARGPVSNCSANGDVLDAGSLAWFWDSTLPAATPLSSSTLNQAVYKAAAETVPGSSTVLARATQGAVNATGTASLVVDYAHCSDDTDCVAGGLCTGSTCNENTHRCSPVITSFGPPSGKIGTWVTVNGCYFGSYGSNSRMIFADDKDGIAFSNAPYCPGLAQIWTDTAVTREVPNQTTGATTDDAVTGPIKIVRNIDGLSDATNINPGPALADYIVNNIERPGLCALVPDHGVAGDTVSLKGHNFGVVKSATDKVQFDTIDVLNSTWNDLAGQTVDVVVPAGLQQPSTVPVHLENEGVSSNALPFSIGTTSTTPAPGAPTVTTFNPQGGSVCRNSVVTAQFSKEMDQATLNASNVSLRPCTAGNCATLGASVGGAIQTSADGFTLFPGFLAKNQTYFVSIGTGAKSKEGVALANAFTWQFTTADTNDPCQLQSVSLTLNPGTPDDSGYHRFTQLLEETTQLPKVTTATAHAWSGQVNASQEIGKIPGVYDWVWDWKNSDTTFADYTPATPGDVTQGQIKPKANGRSVFTITAKAKSPSMGFTGTFAANAVVDVDLCDHPWTYADPTYLFNIFYCRGNGATPSVPELAAPLTKDSVGSCPPDEPALNQACVQREYFFKIKCPQSNVALNAQYCGSGTTDYDIGIRIFPNSALRSARGWFEKNFPASGGSSVKTIDSYPAITVGTTTYIAAPFPNGANPFTSKMYLLSVKDSAPEVSKTIGDALLKSWQFETPSDPTLKAAIARDMARVGDLRDLKTVIDGKVSAGASTPTLASGSFIPGLSTSKWPSWAANLGAELNSTVPVDPINLFAVPNDTCKTSNGYEEATCWNQNSKTFFCPGGSHVYAYQTTGPGNYGLYGNLEYTGTGTWANGTRNLCSGDSTCSCFNYLVGAGTTAAVIDNQPPSTPGSVSSVASNESSIRASWLPSIDLQSGVAGYEVTMATQSAGPFTTPNGVSATVNATSVNVVGLQPGTPYYFRVRAKDYAGNFSAPAAPATGELTAPGNISNFTPQ